MTAAAIVDDSLPSGMTSRHSSESAEHYTPSSIVESARLVLGSIDLDPASSEEANQIVKATRFFTCEDNGFTRPWSGRVFLNPPGGLSDDLERPVKQKCRITGECGLPGGTEEHPGHEHRGIESNQKKWWFRLAEQWWTERVSCSIFVMFSVELLQTTQTDTPKDQDDILLPIPLDFAICFPRSRVKYRKPGGAIGKSPPHSSGIILVSNGRDTIHRFERSFASHGRVILGPIAQKAVS